MARRYTYSTCLNWGGDVPTCEIDVTVTFTVTPGSPETGRFGPPELYDPGSPAEVEDIQVESIDGRPVERAPGLLVPILEKLEDLHDEMLAVAAEADAADADDAADRARRSRIDDTLTGAA